LEKLKFEVDALGKDALFDFRERKFMTKALDVYEINGI
jgi:hypothetical protein